MDSHFRFMWFHLNPKLTEFWLQHWQQNKWFCLSTCIFPPNILIWLSAIYLKINSNEIQFVLSLYSQELHDALGINTKTLPPFIYRMRELGYPPGWLKEAEMENSGLMLYDGKVEFLFLFILLWPVISQVKALNYKSLKIITKGFLT